MIAKIRKSFVTVIQPAFLHQVKKQSSYKNKNRDTESKLGLVTENCTIKTLKELIETFSRHRFNKIKLYRKVITVFTPGQLVKVQYFN